MRDQIWNHSWPQNGAKEKNHQAMKLKRNLKRDSKKLRAQLKKRKKRKLLTKTKEQKPSCPTKEVEENNSMMRINKRKQIKLFLHQ
jgi:hypothetical protein